MRWLWVMVWLGLGVPIGGSWCPAHGQADAESTEVGIDEHLGQSVPLDLVFLDEDGQPVRLGDLVDRPTILTLVYYRCPSICTPLLNGLVDVLERTDLAPGEDYRIVTISFDETETPDLAARKKMNFLKAFHEPFPPESWRFLTGDQAAVEGITGAVGFRFKRTGKDFLHPGVLTVLSPEGRIARYLYGITFLPFDLKLALTEAAQGRTGPTLNRVLLFCYSYDPDGQRYVFNILKVAGTLIMVFAAFFVLWLVITTRKARGRARNEGA